MNFSFKSKPRVDGYPGTDAVEARQLKNSDTIVLRNGGNIFRFSPQRFERLYTTRTTNGAYALMGDEKLALEASQESSPAGKVLATFGSEKAAANAIGKVAKTQGVGKRMRVGVWLAGLIGLYLAFKVIAVLEFAVADAVADASATAPQQQHDAPPVPTGQAALPRDLTEEFERLASGGEYKFAPKLKVPEVELPTLDCGPAK